MKQYMLEMLIIEVHRLQVLQTIEETWNRHCFPRKKKSFGFASALIQRYCKKHSHIYSTVFLMCWIVSGKTHIWLWNENSIPIFVLVPYLSLFIKETTIYFKVFIFTRKSCYTLRFLPNRFPAETAKELQLVIVLLVDLTRFLHADF